MSFQSDIPGQELEHAGTGVEIMLNVKAGQELRLSRGDSSEVTRALLCRWIWAYWLSPFAYSLLAVAINEMTSPAWGEVGIQALESFGFQTSRYLSTLP